jgi:hypothetical protein
MALLRNTRDHPSWHRVRVLSPYAGKLPHYPNDRVGVLSSVWVNREGERIQVTVTSNGNTLVDAATLTIHPHRAGSGLILPKARLISPGASVSVLATVDGRPAEKMEVEMLVIEPSDAACFNELAEQMTVEGGA